MRSTKFKSFLVWSLLISLVLTGLPMKAQAATLLDEYLRLGFLFNVSDPLGEIEAADGALNYVSPDWFGLDWNGCLVVYEQADLEFVRQMHLRDIKVVPFLANSFNANLASVALNNADQLTDDIVAAVERLNLDGVNYDLENVDATERDLQTEFVRLLKEKMPNKHISVSLAANPHNWRGGWHDSYDYAKLAQYSDHIVLMSYELMYYTRYNGNSTSNYGAAVAGEDAMIEAVEDLMERGIPARKILLGIPFYARLWFERPLVKGDTLSSYQKSLTHKDGKALGHLQVERILKHPEIKDLQHVLEPATKSDLSTFRVDETILLPFMRLEPGHYSVYHESQESYTHKMALMRRFNLAGYAAWAVGQENPEFWVALGGGGAPPEIHLIERNFADIKGHWAENQILYGAARSWLSWTKATRFYPNNGVNRAETAATLRRTLNLTLIDKEEIKEFIDVPNTHWAYTDVQTLAYYDLMKGVNVTAPYRFGPYDYLTRAQIATILDRIFFDDGSGLYDEELLTRFSDMAVEYKGHWAEASLARVVEAGLLNGFEDFTLRPEEVLTRAQLMTVLYRVDRLLLQ